jgi:5-methylcytosine-specific restriction endonuclease McrA
MNKLQDRVLILNQSYEPIGTMNIEKAMCKISRPNSSLQVLEWSASRTLSTVKGGYPVPSVLRLLYYVDMVKRRSRSGAKREKIYQRDKFRCQYCGIRVGQMNKALEGGARIMTRNDLTLDHILPQSREGATRPDNLVTCCKPCNQKKADKTPKEANMPLLTPEVLLRVHLDTIAITAYSDHCPEWKKYLFMDNKGEEKLTHTSDHAFG